MKKRSSQNPVSHILTCCLPLLCAAPLIAGSARGPETTIPLVVAPGWNLLSLPLSVSNGDKDSLFPTAVSPAYLFRDPTGYQIQDTLRHGTGFWLKFDSSETVLLTGEVFLRDTIEVQAGWNIIGSLSIPLVFDSLRTEPPGIITAPVYGYLPGTGYSVADTLFPGFGYWVKADQEGVILLASLGGFPCPGTPIVPYAGKTYNTVQIGSQCWLRENLNAGIMIQGSQPQTDNGILEKYCYDNYPPYCETFGGLYQWDEAMQYAGAQGICPPGWHVPTAAEFQTLAASVGGNGNALKALGQGGGGGAGTNSSGFSGLLAGFRTQNGEFYNLGDMMYLWSSNQRDGSSATTLYLASGTAGILESAFPKRSGFSVRCLQGDAPNVAPSSPFDPVPSHQQINVPVTAELRWSCSDSDGDSLLFDVYFGAVDPPDSVVSTHQTDTMLTVSGLTGGTTYYWKVVARDDHDNLTSGPVWSFTTTVLTGLPCPGMPTVDYGGKTYTTVQIGSQCWLRENLDIGAMVPGVQNQTNNGVIEKYCYDNLEAYCDTFGGLYQWDEAMQYSTTPGGQGICPPGWSVPTLTEFGTLNTIVAGAGNALKAVGQGSGAGAGTNASGFSALLAGNRHNDGSFHGLGEAALVWASTEENATSARFLLLGAYDDLINLFGDAGKGIGFSVRCLYDSGMNLPPQTPSEPIPDNGDTSVYTSPILRWTCADPDEDSLTYDIYLGTANPPDTLVSADQDSARLARPGLAGGTTYYWRVVAKDNHAHQTSGPVWSFTTQAGAGLPCPGIPAVTHGGRTYTTVQIGNQCWLRENIDVGTRIDDAQDQSDNGVMEKYCYDNSPAKCDTFGGLYQWGEALQYGSGPGVQGICPPGWHVPSLSELESLGDIVGWDGNALKAVGQGSGAGGGTNASGFSALLAGRRLPGGEFEHLRTYAWIWSSTEDDVDIARTLRLDAGTSSIFMNHYASMNGGLSVRCLKD